MKLRVRSLVALAALVAVALWIVLAFRPTPLIVDVAAVRRAELVVTVDDDGKTRVRERYVVYAPVRGRLLRTPLHPGDVVHAGKTRVAEFEPLLPAVLDERARAEAEARVRRAHATVQESLSRHAQAEAEATFADAELVRVSSLQGSGIVAPATIESAERDARARRSALRAAEFALRVAEFDVDVATAAAGDFTPSRAEGQAENEVASRRIGLPAPIDGVVLRVYEESERPLEAGAPLVELGDLRAIEVVADFLSQDAVRVRPGMLARITGWGGDDRGSTALALAATVRIVEPSGYTKVSALGVEEQRVDIVLDPAGDLAGWAALGDGYRVDVHIEIWRGEDLLVVPTGALFREGERDAVYVLASDGTARIRSVRLGRRTGLEAEVLAGLAAGDRVVLYPSAMVADGKGVVPR